MLTRTILPLILAACAFGQAVPKVLPTYVGAGAAYNQIGTPIWNIWATAVYPVVNSVGLYASTSTDITPLQKTDPATKRLYWSFTTSVRQGLHKVVMSRGALTFLVGGDAGVGMSQADPSGVNVGLSGSFTGTAVWKLGKSWAVVVPVRGLWVNTSWNLIPEIGILFCP
jgi:hypothetical protein